MKRIFTVLLAGAMFISPMMVSATENTNDIKGKLSQLTQESVNRVNKYYNMPVVGSDINYYDLQAKTDEALTLLSASDKTDEEYEIFYDELLRCIESVGELGYGTAPHPLGDANWDYKFDINDATDIQRALVECEDNYFIAIGSYDMDGDRTVTIHDVTKSQRALADMGDKILFGYTNQYKYTLSGIKYFYRPNLILLDVTESNPFADSGMVSLDIIDDSGNMLYQGLQAEYSVGYDKKCCYVARLKDNRKYLMAEKTYKLVYTSEEQEVYEAEVTPQAFDTEVRIK